MKPRRRVTGVSLLELVIAMAVLAFALMALMSSISSSSTLQQNTREKVIAYNAAREIVEQLRAATFSEVWARYNSTTADDPVSGVKPGNTFHVAGLNMPKVGPASPTTWRGANNVPDGYGFITWPEKAGALDETFVDATMGMPRDLNRDGVVTGAITTYDILPVKITVRWQTLGGTDFQIEVNTFITEK